MEIQHAAAILGRKGGKSGIGVKKRRTPKQYRNMAMISAAKRFMPFEERFWAKVDISNSDSCWNWRGCLNKNGYGIVSYEHHARLAHRMAWFLKNGMIPDNLCVLHKCDNPKCCNCNHLFLGTQADNNEDMMRKGRHKAKRGQDSPVARLSNETIRAIRNEYQPFIISHSELAKKYGVSKASISHICSGRTWRHIHTDLVKHAFESAKGELNKSHKVTTQDVVIIRQRAANGETQSKIATTFGVTKDCIQKIVSGKNWRHLL